MAIGGKIVIEYFIRNCKKYSMRIAFTDRKRYNDVEHFVRKCKKYSKREIALWILRGINI